MREYFYKSTDPHRPIESSVVTEMSTAEYLAQDSAPVGKTIIKTATGDNMESNTFSFSKNHPGYGLVAKCMNATRTQDFTGLTRADFDTAIDAVSKSLAAQENISYGDAVQALLSEEQGRALYSGREQCPAVGQGSAIQKHDATVNKAAEQERAAQQHSDRYGVPIEQARREVAQYYEVSF